MSNDVTHSAFKYDYLGSDSKAIQRSVSNHLVYTIGKDPFTATEHDWMMAFSHVVRDRLIERWMETQRSYYKHDAKRVYYLSMEFLIGRSLINSLLNMDIHNACGKALKKLGIELERLRSLEHDAALGNGGLGRLAACFLDSMASLNIPGYGYGIRFEYGMFRQQIDNGNQIELPENWLVHDNPWEFPRPEVSYRIRYGGRVMEYQDSSGRRHFDWIDGDIVIAQAYDTPIPGYHNDTVNNLRLWSAKAHEAFDLNQFNQGEYTEAVVGKTLSENISKVLYPNDSSTMNKLLRLKQQYFFVSASLKDILRRFFTDHDDLHELPDKVAIQLNDTHPAIAIPEMMRLLMDKHQLEWQPAWEITTRVFSYTNHTLLPEALETWPVKTFETLLPRHLQVILEINRRFLLMLGHRHPGDMDILRRLSIIDERGERRIRMAHLAIIGSHKVNGVSALHSELLRNATFRDFDRFYPGKIINITNGITPRRWLYLSNRRLSSLISDAIGPEWVKDLSKIQQLEAFAEDHSFQEKFAAIKLANKKHISKLINYFLEKQVDPHTLFDVQVKRIHEYKRQLLNLFRAIELYNRLVDDPGCACVPRTFLFGGKAAPGYSMAKLIIRLINDVADVIDNDPAVSDRLKIIFIPNYDVTTATDIIPAAELSQQISTAGMEASGTGNMKLALNGALTMGTMDGANVEMREQLGDENIFIFGLQTDDIARLNQLGYQPRQYYESDPRLRRIIDMIANGFFSPEEPTRYRMITDSLLNVDHFKVLADFDAYMGISDQADTIYQQPDTWNRMAILNTARMGYFSSDRTISEYAEKIWQVSPVSR
ncbi:MAG: glycogen/starch/alpha-glucan phosphorylase [Candidatus Thiodiazotropha weberae]|uniref:Alpha-1,4 glucan phosphorylase n=1 Tax=Candidatus Thiodiazotropha endoloripes TaxID=1818881 RepID=A0A1E2UMF3_9GAMM|nr:glycogen/starch/alpha-glucan phosphorylase [Candidatus Thiodiazotropha endoloripes]MCG7897451.1 glycogen/starch/alpha-glucan phosphorylase [Candidatus Thiodiazotropha weberae]MCG7903662.1 glycogen/starch/alpha-glucan phosphorylase [Candidatus Thiodiazotropha weberae]ODB91557.1 glycogen phosphorylase [Candidatus Thiodiazotropha endoloripes]ODB95762.1 glycogen phosphorylase [Candidatus Thiodiazotropha endoloripes]